MRTGIITTSTTVHHSASWDSSMLGFFRSLAEQPAILVGLFALVGCLIQRKKASETIVSVAKIVIGFFILAAGAAALTTSLHGLTKVLSNALGLENGKALLIPSNEAMMAWFIMNSSNIMLAATLILLLGMMFNIFLARFSRLKYIYLTGHVAFYLAIAIAGGMDTIGIHPMQSAGDAVIVILGGGLLLGLYMAFAPALTTKFATKVTGEEGLAVGHTGSLNFVLAGLIGQGVAKVLEKRGKPIVSTESVKVPEKIGFLKNGMVSTIITMLIVFGVITIVGLSIRGLDAFNDMDGSLLGLDEWSGINWGYAITFPLISALSFTAGVQIILFGVRMFLEELAPAFSGISNKLVKGAKPAVAIQAFWDKNPNAVIFGFLSSFTAGLIVFGITAGIHFGGDGSVPMILPQLIPHFFLGATAAIFANAYGGYKGAIIGAFISGVIIMVFPLAFYYANLAPTALVDDISAIWSDPDAMYAAVGVGIATGAKWAFFAVILILFFLPVIYNYAKAPFDKRKGKKTGTQVVSDEIISKEKQINKKEVKNAK